MGERGSVTQSVGFLSSGVNFDNLRFSMYHKNINARKVSVWPIFLLNSYN